MRPSGMARLGWDDNIEIDLTVCRPWTGSIGLRLGQVACSCGMR
jgi:hypothetical protein